MLALGPDGSYTAVVPDAEGNLRSTVLPGVWAEPRWMFLDELPSVVRLGTAMAEAGDAERSS